MSYGGYSQNPDRRSLPQGWIERYDDRYQTWFYINTMENPPRSSWVHPLGPLRTGQYVQPPPGPPPPFDPYAQQYPPQGGYNGGYGGPPQQWGPPPGPGYYGGPPQGGYGGGYGGNQGYYGGNSPQPVVQVIQPVQPIMQQQPNVTIIEERRHHHDGFGVGGALLAGGAGLVGGALLMDAIDDNRFERDAAFDVGYMEGREDGFIEGEFF